MKSLNRHPIRLFGHLGIAAVLLGILGVGAISCSDEDHDRRDYDHDRWEHHDRDYDHHYDHDHH